MKKILSFFLLLIIGVSLTSCSFEFNFTDEGTTTISQTEEFNYRISTKDPYIDLYAGETAYIQYTLNFELEEGEKLEFTSSDMEVAKVLSTGYVIAKGKGTCKITVSYKTASLTFFVTVSQDSGIEKPTKLSYYIGETIDLTGCKVLYYNADGTVDKTIDVTSDMVSEIDMDTAGDKLVTITYKEDSYTFYISVMEREFEPYLMKNVTITNESIETGDAVYFKIEPKNVTYLRETINSVYDYTEFKILVDIETPSGKVDTVYAYYTQDFKESRKNLTSMNSSRNMEGYVFNKDGYNFEITYTKQGQGYFAAKYIPKETGTYSYTINSYSLDTTLIETFDGDFTATKGKDSKGVIKVADNKRTFEFENGDTYIPVGENVAWYNSAQRRIGDYEVYFNSLAENNANYARVWLSGFSFALFWDNVENYDTRLDEAQEIDKLFEMAEDLGIYINLTLFHHGMFSEKVNPMWPNNTNTWYTTKYGPNSYSKKLSSPGEFFTTTYGKKWCKNYLTYIAARYGYSPALMSYEIFNEVDWVESYTADMGSRWHDEMAKHLQLVDYLGHMVTTSVKGDDFNSDIYQVFKLDSIAYVNVHNYGAKSYLTTIPGKLTQGYKKFDKPIMYQEVGYSGNSGDDQHSKDPNDVTLHQELWAGIMSSGASAMNWWWDSWVEKYDAYAKFSGPGKYASLMDLRGTMTLAYGSSRVSFPSLTGSNLVTLGYLFTDKAYLYVFNKNYTVDNTSASIGSTMTLSDMDSGSYTVEFYDTYTGNVTKTQTLTAVSGKLTISVNGTNDVALIIKKK